MKRLLICTIIRNQRLNLDRWWDQIVGLHNEIGQEWEISLSVVENDSNDGTVDWLNDLRKGWDSVADKSAFKQLWMTTEMLGTQQYGSVWNQNTMTFLKTKNRLYRTRRYLRPIMGKRTHLGQPSPRGGNRA